MASHHLPPLSHLADNPTRLLQIKREQLVPLFDDAKHRRVFEIPYADSIIHDQQHHLAKIHLAIIPSFAEKLSQIMHILHHIDQAKPKKFNRLQKWLGQDIEYYAQSLSTQRQLKTLIEQVKIDRKILWQQQQKSEQSLQNLLQLRQDMAEHILALQQFIEESHQFSQNLVGNGNTIQQLQQQFKQRLQHLLNVQTTTDMAMLQMILNQDVALTLAARVEELLNVVLPSWHHYINAQYSAKNGQQLKELQNMRLKLLQDLQQAMSHFSTHP